MSDDFPADELIEAAEEDPEYFISLLAARWGESDFTVKHLLRDAAVFAQYDVNLFEILEDHPDVVEDRFGSDIELDELIDRVDRLADRME